MQRPINCEIWCSSWGHGNCNCDFDERVRRYELDYRAPGATPLPRAVARFRRVGSPSR